MRLNKKTLSLVETLIALAIVSLISVSMFMTFQRGFYLIRKAKAQTAAYALAQGILELYYDWAKITALGNGTHNSGSSSDLNDETLNNIVYSYTLEIADGPVFGTNLKKLTVTVTWPDSSVPVTGTKSIFLSTLRANFSY